MSPDLSELTRVGNWVNELARRWHVPAATVERVDLCSTEVVTNIVMHGHPGSQEIALRLECRPEHLALEIQDDGPPFDPCAATAPAPATSLAEATIGGWGIPIVRRFSDDWHYERSDGRNQLTLLFRLTTGTAEASPTAD